MKINLTDLDFAIYEELKKDSRQTIANLSKKLKKPRSTIFERIKRLKSSGLLSLTTKLDYEALGYVSAFVFVSAVPNRIYSQEQLEKELSNNPEVVECYKLAGTWDFLLKVRAKSISQLGKKVVGRIRALKGVNKTKTIVIFETIKVS